MTVSPRRSVGEVCELWLPESLSHIQVTVREVGLVGYTVTDADGGDRHVLAWDLRDAQ